MPCSAAIRRANQVFPVRTTLTAQRSERQATAEHLASSVPPTCTISDKDVSFTVKVTSDLFDVEHAQIWRIFEENMYELYRSSSFGWDPREKQREMFDPSSRFVIARDVSGATNDPPGIIAYSIFRFDRENCRNVVYCYELQVVKDARRLGLGRLLTQVLSDIGARWGMTKVMLTVFKANHAAMAFYKSIGFTTDAVSPDFSDECDYSILSRRIS